MPSKMMGGNRKKMMKQEKCGNSTSKSGTITNENSTLKPKIYNQMIKTQVPLNYMRMTTYRPQYTK